MNIHQLKQYLFNNLWCGEGGRKPKAAENEFVYVVMPNVFKVWGGDWSHWNIPPVDMLRMKEQFGMSFAIIKARDGSLNTRYVAEHVKAANDAGLPFGLYVWLYPNNKVSIDAQVKAWAEAYQLYKPALGIFIDAEWTTYGGQPANPTASDLRMAHDKLKALIGKTSTTYTAAGYADSYLTGFDWSREPLWIANYGVSSPLLPKGVTTWEYWQFTNQLDGATLDPNGNKSLDGNYYNGTAEQFAAKWGGTQPPNGGTMQRYQVTGPNGMNLRPAVGVNNTPLLLMQRLGYVWGVLDPATNWIHGTHYQQVGDAFATPLDFWCYFPLTATVEFVAPVVAPVVSKITEIVLDLAAGSVVTIKREDGTIETETA